MIDAHHHFWWSGRRKYTWPDAVGDRFARDFTPDDLRPELARCGIKGTVLIQVLHEVGGETEECLDFSQEVGFVRGVVGWLPLADPDATAGALERLRRRGKLVGVRHLISYEPDPRWLLQDGVTESLEILAAAGLVFDAIPVNAAQFESVLELAGRLPELKIVVDHLGRPPIPEQGWEPWATHVARASEHRNIVDEALDRSRHHHALAMVERCHPALFRPRARPVRSRPRDGGEQLAGDPVGCQLSGNLERHHRLGRRPFRSRAPRGTWVAPPSGSMPCDQTGPYSNGVLQIARRPYRDANSEQVAIMAPNATVCRECTSNNGPVRLAPCMQAPSRRSLHRAIELRTERDHDLGQGLQRALDFFTREAQSPGEHARRFCNLWFGHAQRHAAFNRGREHAFRLHP